MSEYSVRIKAVIVALAMNAGIFAACAQAQTHNHTRGQTGDQTESRSAQSRFILEIGNRAISLLRTKQISEADRTARFGELLQTGFDLDYIGRFVLGRHWRAASDPQRAAYLDLFSQFVVKTYASRLQGYSGESFAIVSERVAGIKDSVVRTRIGRPGGGAAIDADWRVRKYHDSYRIVDGCRYQHGGHPAPGVRCGYSPGGDRRIDCRAAVEDRQSYDRNRKQLIPSIL